jgi:hypothetical protein
VTWHIVYKDGAIAEGLIQFQTKESAQDWIDYRGFQSTMMPKEVDSPKIEVKGVDNVQ